MKRCKHCNNEFSTKSWNAIYCSNICKQRQWTVENSIKKQQLCKTNYEKNKEVRKINGLIWRSKNKDKVKANVKNWKVKNKDKHNSNRRNQHKTRLVDPLYKLNCTIRGTIVNAIRNSDYGKNSKTYEILGCSKEYLYEHLKKSFKENYGVEYEESFKHLLHVDHIIPLASASSEEELIKLNHFSNLQYLHKIDNQRKKDRLDWSKEEITPWEELCR